MGTLAVVVLLSVILVLLLAATVARVGDPEVSSPYPVPAGEDLRHVSWELVS